MRLIVCGAAERDALIAEAGPSHVVTIASPGHAEPVVRPGLAHLHLAFHDVTEPRGGLRPASADVVARLLAFGRAWDETRPLLVACEFGVSRSPAAAFALACQGRPDLPPRDVARQLRVRAPQATPNPLVVSHADRLLDRGGAMIAAMAAIGRGRDYAGPAAFWLTVGQTADAEELS